MKVCDYESLKKPLSCDSPFYETEQDELEVEEEQLRQLSKDYVTKDSCADDNKSMQLAKLVTKNFRAKWWKTF